jgi:hypothetical protein
MCELCESNAKLHAAANVDDVVARVDFGKPSAVKRGRRKEWPYVPVVDFGKQEVGPRRRTDQIEGYAFETREEAVAFAARFIEGLRVGLAKKLRDPRYRALRTQHGLPQEAADLPDGI